MVTNNKKFFHECFEDEDNCIFCETNTLFIPDDQECPILLRKRIDEDEKLLKKIHEIVLRSIHKLSGNRICNYCDSVEDEECDISYPVYFLRDASRIIEDVIENKNF